MKTAQMSKKHRTSNLEEKKERAKGGKFTLWPSFIDNLGGGAGITTKKWNSKKIMRFSSNEVNLRKVD